MNVTTNVSLWKIKLRLFNQTALSQSYSVLDKDLLLMKSCVCVHACMDMTWASKGSL